MNRRTSLDTELLAAANNPDSPTCLSITVPLTRQEVAVEPAEPGCLGRVVAGPGWWGSPDNPSLSHLISELGHFLTWLARTEPASRFPPPPSGGTAYHSRSLTVYTTAAVHAGLGIPEKLAFISVFATSV